MNRLLCNATLGLLFSVFVLACGGDDQAQPSEPAPQDAGTDVVVEAQDDALEEAAADAHVAESLTVEVTYESHPYYRWTGETAGPLEGALVAVELPDGTFVERLTDAAGKVEFGDDVWSSVDWASETVPITFHKAGLPVMTYAGLSHEELFERRGGVLRRTFIEPKRDSVPLTATPIGTSGGANALVHASTSTWSACATASASAPVALEAASGFPFSVVAYEFKDSPSPCALRCGAMEILGWTRGEFGLAEDGMHVELDFGQSVAPVRTTGRVTLPASPESKLRLYGQLGAEVNVADDLEIGKPSRTALAADGSAFTYDLEYLTWDSADNVRTVFFLVSGSSQSEASVAGYPQDDLVIDDMLDLPTLVSPSSPSTPVSITDPIEWTTPDAVEAGTVVVYRGSEPAWQVVDFAITGSGSMKLPRLPPSIDAADVLGAATMDAVFALLASNDPDLGYYLRSVYVMFKVQP